MAGKHYSKRFQRRRKELKGGDLLKWHIESGVVMQWIIRLLKKYGPTIGKYLGGLAAAGLTALVAKMGFELSAETQVAVSAAVMALVIEAINLLYIHREKVRQKAVQRTLNQHSPTLVVDGRVAEKTLYELDKVVAKAQLWEDAQSTENTKG